MVKFHLFFTIVYIKIKILQLQKYHRQHIKIEYKFRSTKEGQFF